MRPPEERRFPLRQQRQEQLYRNDSDCDNTEKDKDVTIANRDPHRIIHRAIFDRQNGGAKFANISSQNCSGYDTHKERPIVNRFPGHKLQDPTEGLSREDFLDYCGSFKVLPDFYKFWGMQLAMNQRSEFWKLDFNSEGWLARNFTPHGAPALKRDTDGSLQFIVSNGFQMHGGVGERLGLQRKLPASTWNNVRERAHPG